jgi:hypothetical protein
MALTGNADDTQLMSAFGGKADMMKTRRHVRFGLKADISACPCDVRFTPKSGHWNSVVKSLCQKQTTAISFLADVQLMVIFRRRF